MGRVDGRPKDGHLFHHPSPCQGWQPAGGEQGEEKEDLLPPGLSLYGSFASDSFHQEVSYPFHRVVGERKEMDFRRPPATPAEKRQPVPGPCLLVRPIDTMMSRFETVSQSGRP